jgi:hypothetical protein
MTGNGTEKPTLIDEMKNVYDDKGLNKLQKKLEDPDNRQALIKLTYEGLKTLDDPSKDRLKSLCTKSIQDSKFVINFDFKNITPKEIRTNDKNLSLLYLYNALEGKNLSTDEMKNTYNDLKSSNTTAQTLNK